MIWSRLKENLSPSNLLLTLLGPSFVLFLAALGLMPYNSAQAGLLAWVPLLFFFFWTSDLLTLVVWLGLFIQSLFLFSWGVIPSALWLFSFHLSLVICSLMLKEFKQMLESKKTTEENHHQELTLWKTRFDALHEKMQEDQKVWEKEIEDREEQLKTLDVVQQEKRKRAETLLGTSRKKAISLESIAKGVKRESKE